MKMPNIPDKCIDHRGENINLRERSTFISTFQKQVACVRPLTVLLLYGAFYLLAGPAERQKARPTRVVSPFISSSLFLPPRGIADLSLSDISSCI